MQKRLSLLHSLTIYGSLYTFFKGGDDECTFTATLCAQHRLRSGLMQ